MTKEMCRTCGREDHIIQCNDGSCEDFHLDDNKHCHDGKNYDYCIPFIEDCKEHAERCISDCHSECACQERV